MIVYKYETCKTFSSPHTLVVWQVVALSCNKNFISETLCTRSSFAAMPILGSTSSCRRPFQSIWFSEAHQWTQGSIWVLCSLPMLLVCFHHAMRVLSNIVEVSVATLNWWSIVGKQKYSKQCVLFYDDWQSYLKLIITMRFFQNINRITRIVLVAGKK